MTEINNEETHFTFPCEYPLKIIGLAPDVKQVSLPILQQYIPGFTEDLIQSRPSLDNKYLALTVTFTAESKAQLDAIYQALTAHKDVIRMVL